MNSLNFTNLIYKEIKFKLTIFLRKKRIFIIIVRQNAINSPIFSKLEKFLEIQLLEELKKIQFLAGHQKITFFILYPDEKKLQFVSSYSNKNLILIKNMPT